VVVATGASTGLSRNLTRWRLGAVDDPLVERRQQRAQSGKRTGGLRNCWHCARLVTLPTPWVGRLFVEPRTHSQPRFRLVQGRGRIGQPITDILAVVEVDVLVRRACDARTVGILRDRNRNGQAVILRRCTKVPPVPDDRVAQVHDEAVARVDRIRGVVAGRSIVQRGYAHVAAIVEVEQPAACEQKKTFALMSWPTSCAKVRTAGLV
jgi:hypothetical protein